MANGVGFMVRSRFVDNVFPSRSNEIEFLPVFVDGEEWMFINCLKVTSGYDEGRSKFMRDGGREKQIFMINHVVVTDASVKEAELFTLDDSNRAWIIATDSFVERVRQLDLRGLGFREIGFLERGE